MFTRSDRPVCALHVRVFMLMRIYLWQRQTFQCWWQLWQCGALIISETSWSPEDTWQHEGWGDGDHQFPSWASCYLFSPTWMFILRSWSVMRREWWWSLDINVLERSVPVFFVQSRITSVLVSIENIFSPKSSISSALNKGWSPPSWRGGVTAAQERKIKFPTKTDLKRWTKREFVYSDSRQWESVKLMRDGASRSHQPLASGFCWV